ncbi:TniB family NTP-binding protein [Pseudomonas sichuanensis]|uniref:TniB family NTP-binding protein n=1 Tax=Pseudomonas sichuanensis TaxID=2213015 RepID=UPI002AB83C6A|nr:TniB family NTP-binding protein [Pseudomonas sichuanensis]MDZ4019262.1 hypothetical protein [Pseudomonas sichuanensis]
MNYPHLHSKTASIISNSPEARIEWMKERRWFGYPRAQEIIEQLEELLAHPRVDRMPNLCLVGRTNNGKSSICREFYSRHPLDENPQGEYIIAPVLYIECPGKPSEGGIYAEILRVLYERVIPSSVEAKKSLVISVMRKIQVKILIIDELHNLSVVGGVMQHQILTCLKYLSNTLRLSIVACGDARLPRIMRIDEQIENRFRAAVIPKWKLDKGFRQLLMSFERILPLREASNLHERELATLIYAKCEGTIGELAELLKSVAQTAILNGEEKITAQAILNCKYVSPSDRSKEFSEV